MRKQLSLLTLLLGCGQTDTTGLTLCDGAPPRCAARQSPCALLLEVEAECSIERSWRCPQGAQPMPAPHGDELNCSPFFDSLQLVTALGPSFELEGTCHAGLGQQGWVIEQSAPYPADGSRCPTTRQPQPMIDRAQVRSDLLLDITDTVHLPEGTFALYRLFEQSPSAPFGVWEHGSGVAPVVDGQVRVPSSLMWTDAGYRSATLHEGHLYVSWCGNAPEALMYTCSMSRVHPDRLMDPEAYELLDDSAFTAGPQHSLRYYPGRGAVISTAAGFGDRIVIKTAKSPADPWREAREAPRCALPDDPEAFCDQVRQHPYLMHPDEPARLVLSYRIGSLSEDKQQRQTQNPAGYTARMLTTRVPD